MRKETANSVKAILHPTQTTFTTLHGHTVLLQSLSYYTLSLLSNLHVNNPNTLHLAFVTESLVHKEAIGLLIYSDITDIANIVVSMSSVSMETVTAIQDALDVLQDEKYTKSDFDCTECKKRKLDIHRNCPLLPTTTHSKSVKWIINNKRVVTVCPMDAVGKSKVGEAFALMRMLEVGQLPMAGGVLEQTAFVNEVIPLVKPLIDAKNVRLM